MDIQRLRNLTTRKLHTHIGDVYEDIEYITGEKGIMTHMIPNAMTALDPWLKEKKLPDRFWDGEHDVTHVGDVDIEPMTENELSEFWARYKALPSPLDIFLKGKK